MGGRTAEAAFTAGATRTALTTWATESARASLAAGHATLAAAHRFTQPVHALGELLLGHLAIGVLIHSGEAAFDFLAGKGGVLFFVHAAVGIAVHFLEDLFATRHPTGASRTPRPTKATTTTFATLSRRATLWAAAFWPSFRGWAAFWASSFGWTTEATAFGCTRSRTSSAALAFTAATTAHAAELFADLLDLCSIDEAIGIAIDTAKAFFEFAALALDEFLFADFAIGIGIGFLHELFDAAGTIAAWGALSFLRLGGDHGCAGKTEAIDECLFGFHSVE